MIARARFPVLVILLAAIAAYGISLIPSLGLASADVAAIEPPPESARTPAPAIPADLPTSDPVVDDAIAMWRRGEYVAAFVVSLFLLCTALLRVDPARAWVYTAGVTVLGGLVGSIAAGVTPNLGMLIGAGAALLALIMRGPGQPTPARQPQRGSIAGSVLVWLLSLTTIIGGGLIWSCAGTREAVRQTGRDIVDCTTVTASAHTAAYGARIEAAIKEHTVDGETDWGKVGAVVGDIMQEAGLEVAGCVARATFERLLGVPTLAGPDLRAGWERVRVEVLGGRRYLPEVR